MDVYPSVTNRDLRAATQEEWLDEGQRQLAREC